MVQYRDNFRVYDGDGSGERLGGFGSLDGHGEDTFRQNGSDGLGLSGFPAVPSNLLELTSISLAGWFCMVWMVMASNMTDLRT